LADRSVTGLFLGFLWLGLLAAVATPPLLAISTAPAHAQEEQTVRRGGGILQFLFGRREQRATPVEPDTHRAAKRRSANPGAVAPAEPKPQLVDKLDDARTILVVGDFLAAGLAEGLDEAFAQAPGIRVVARASGSSGFVRDDYYDWPNAIGPIIDEVKPAAVLVMLGSNDRQQLVVDGNRENVRSEAWMKEYGQRATKLADAIRQAGVPLLWVGMPSFKAGAMSADMVALNDVFRTVAEAAGGEFIDIWDGFVDENGAFASVGPDINGQRVRLRNSDGINMSRAGKRKVAFYAERPLNRLLGGAAAPGIASLGPAGAAAAPGVDLADIDRTQPIALADPALDGAEGLLGGTATAHHDDARTPIEQLVRKGIAGGRTGRADDFAAAPVVAAPAVPASVETTATIPAN